MCSSDLTGARSGAASSAFYWDTMSQDAKKALVGGAGKGEGDGSKLVMYLRGDRTESGKAFREQLQSAVIGHIINSQPVYIGAPVDRGYRYLPATFGSTPSGAKSYTAYVAQKVARSCSTALQAGFLALPKWKTFLALMTKKRFSTFSVDRKSVV